MARLEDISMHINAKKSIAIVGESGSGKSTLVDLIALLHTPTNGKIFIDGTNGNDISKHSWRSQLGYVSQETIIFDDTIANNICMWSGDYINDKNLFTKIRKAANQANILDFIDSLDDGFNSLVGDRGVLLSGGQRQRLFVARELFRNPNLLILDEATSALDSESEKEIQKSIDNLKGEITVIAIAHRLSTIKNVDLIYVLKDGRIIESGSYQIHRLTDDLVVIPYDTGSTKGTEMSFDVSGNYFDLKMDLLEAGYSYGIKVAYYEQTVNSYVEQPHIWKFRVEEV